MDKRILLLGSPVSGKTRLAKKISKKLSIPHIEVDEVLWKSQKGGEENKNFNQNLEILINKNSSYVIEGQVVKSFPIIKNHITHLVYLHPSLVRLWFRGTIRFIKNRNFKEFKMNFNPKSFKNRQKIKALLLKNGVIELKENDLRTMK